MMRKSLPGRMRQSGTALIVALVLLVALMLLGISGLSGVSLQMRMGTGLYDRQIAFQAADAGMRAAEQAVLPTAVPAPVFDGNNGLYPTPDPTVAGFEYRWEDGDTAWQSAPAVVSGPRTLTPQYIAEFMGQHEDWYRCTRSLPIDPLCLTDRVRITSRSSAPADGASVVLQSTFKP